MGLRGTTRRICAWSAALAGALACAAALLPTPAEAGQRWTPYTRPATYGIVEEPNVSIRMRDGVVLRANVARPDAPGPHPALIIQTPYNKDFIVNEFLGGTSNWFVQRGYAVVTVDVRGTGASGGTWDSFGPNEQRDGAQVVRWVRRQPWSNGRIGLTGPSYMAITQLYTAAQRPKGLRAIFPIVPLGDGYRDIVFTGGQINIAFIPLWLGLVTAGSIVPSPNAVDPSDPVGSLLSSLTALVQHVAGALSFQVPAVLDSAVGGEIAFDGPFWKTRSPLEVVDRINVPTFVVGGLHDIFQRGEPLIYERLKNRVPARLLIGPWTHVGASTGQGLPRDGVPDLREIALRWFDRWVMGKRRATRIARMPRVTQWVWGRERYEVQRDWPSPRLRPKRLHLRGGGRLAHRAPSGPEPAQSFLQHPLSGICTQSTVQWTAGLLEGIPCTTDNRLNELGEATYTTAPLKRPLRIDGPALADLWVTTTARDAVLSVRLTDVAPDGTSRELTSGWLAASFRAVDRSRSRVVGGRLLQPWHPFTKASVRPVTPGVPTRMRIEVFPTSAVIKPGHRLRLSVGPSDFPHQLPPLPQALGSLLGQVRVLTDDAHPSFVELPARRKECGGKCRPYPVPQLIRGRQ
ncbi:MAG TPA: CocE/NonD family hydrolase [Solirubrobacterales bacterium]